MKKYSVQVTAITTVNVEAESEDEAIDKACGCAWEYDADELHGKIVKEDD